MWGSGWRGLFFKIPTLIKADTQPSHECIWRNVPIFKTNDDCLALLRKMELPLGPRQSCVDEAEIVATHPGENIQLRRAIKVVESKSSRDLGNFLKGKSDCLGIWGDATEARVRRTKGRSWWSVQGLSTIGCSRSWVCGWETLIGQTGEGT